MRDTNLCSRCIYLILDLFTVPQEHSLKVVPEFKKLEVTGGFQVDLQKEAVLKMPSLFLSHSRCKGLVEN